MRVAEPATQPATPTHWRAESNATWRWYERENLVNGQWTLTGITTPIHKKTGQPYTGHGGYLDENLVPAEIRGGDQEGSDKLSVPATAEPGDGQPDAARRCNTDARQASGCGASTPMNCAFGSRRLMSPRPA